MRLRASLGTLGVLGIKQIRTDCEPTTGYFLLGHGCGGRCSFCPQSAAVGDGANRLSRMIWPTVDMPALTKYSRKLRGLRRICFQCLDYPELHRDLCQVVPRFRNELDYSGPISASLNAMSEKKMAGLKEAGLSDVCIPLDLAGENLFRVVKGGGGERLAGEDTGQQRGAAYSYERIKECLEEASEVFGEGRVTTHLIVGLGETDKEMIECLEWLFERKITVGLFAFTPVPGTPAALRNPPSVSRYRALQFAMYVLRDSDIGADSFSFDEMGRLRSFEGMRPSPSDWDMEDLMYNEGCYRTSGCVGCNRPYYNERPGHIPYNFPRHLTEEELEGARETTLEYIYGERED